MPRFRKRAIVIEAVRWDGNNWEEIEAFIQHGDDYEIGADTVVLHTLEGDMRAGVGDWIIKGVAGEFYPRKPDIFEATYEGVDTHDDC